MGTGTATNRTGEERKTARTGRNRTGVIAAVLCLCASVAQAGENPSSIPIYSGPDGTEAWVEVSRNGNRVKAVPALEIPRGTARRISAAVDAGNGLLAPASGDGNKADRGQAAIGDFLERYKSLVVREEPGGVSLGNAVGLVGDIRDALEKGKTGTEKVRAVTNVLRHTPPGQGPLRGTSGEEERPVADLLEEPGGIPTSCVRCSLGGS